MAAAGEPTEEPTQKRVDEARARGEVAVSRDLTSAAAMTAAILALVVGGGAMVAALRAYFGASLASATRGGPPGPALADGLSAMSRAIAPPLAAAVAVALGVGLLQTRGLVALGALKPDLARLSPAAGLKRAFGGQAALAVGKGLLKVLLVAGLAWVTVRPALRGLTALVGLPADRMLGVLGALAAPLAERVAVVALALGVADYLFAYRRHRRGLRMTRNEVKREYREMEGDPSHRAERQRLHRELLEQRMVAEVRKADFVVVNPDHIAVALRYERDGDAAPLVVARGERLLAERIKDVARQAGVPIFRDVSLARSLRDWPEGEEIPAALYEAVAEILRVLYDMDARPPPPPTASAAVPIVPRGAGWKRA